MMNSIFYNIDGIDYGKTNKLKILTYKYNYSKMALLSERVETFKFWPNQNEAKKFGEVGFYLTKREKSDILRSFKVLTKLKYFYFILFYIFFFLFY
jgi:hypothetical protein